MANKIYYQEDCNLSLLEGKTIAVIGYGSQGHGHSHNVSSLLRCKRKNSASGILSVNNCQNDHLVVDQLIILIIP